MIPVHVLSDVTIHTTTFSLLTVNMASTLKSLCGRRPWCQITIDHSIKIGTSNRTVHKKYERLHCNAANRKYFFCTVPLGRSDSDRLCPIVVHRQLSLPPLCTFATVRTTLPSKGVLSKYLSILHFNFSRVITKPFVLINIIKIISPKFSSSGLSKKPF